MFPRCASGLFWIAIALSLLLACSDRRILASKESREWRYDTELTAQLKDETLSNGETLILSISHDRDYGYSNLYLQLRVKYPNGTMDSSIHSIELMDDQGQWLGKSRGDLVSMDHLLFASGDSLPEEIHVHQYSRDSVLSGISRLELSVFKL